MTAPAKPNAASPIAGFMARAGHYCRLMRINKPIGTLLLLWPTLWALWIAAGGYPGTHTLLLFTLGTFVMRAAGCIINDIADRHIDGHVTRTAQRPLATHDLSVSQALILFGLLLCLAAAIVWQFNRFTLEMSIIGLILAIIYPFSKRVMHCPQAVLGITFAWGIPMAFAAVQNRVPPIGWLLFVAAGLHVIAYDTYYAMADRPDDIKIGVKSSAIWLGRYDLRVILALQTIFLGILAYIGWHLQLKSPFWTALAASLGFIAYQQRLALFRAPAGCFKAFVNTQWLDAVLFLGLVFSLL